MKKQLVIGTAFLLILIGLCGCNERVPTSNNNEQQEPLTEYQEWQMQHFGSIDSEIAHYTDDPDNDYVDNLFEYENGTNPLREYTYEGLDDFNLLYTYLHYISNFSFFIFLPPLSIIFLH